MRRLTCAGHAIVELALGLLADEVSRNLAEGLESVRQLWTRNRLCGTSPNICVSWSGRMGVWVPSAGKNRLQAVAIKLSKHSW